MESSFAEMLTFVRSFSRSTFTRRLYLKEIISRRCLKIYYGCGHVKQPGYVNIDIRWTPAVDLLASLDWCARRLQDCCSEVYLSHVLEHYASPGKSMRDEPDTVIGALKKVYRMLMPGGLARIAVPDFGVISSLYVNGKQRLYPRVLGRLCGEQNYHENLHRCIFDREFLTLCLLTSGFDGIEEWDPSMLNLHRDASFDELDGIKTSLNLVARKSSHP